MEALHSRRTYDYRIQEAICEFGDRDLFLDLNIPRSTIRSWIHRGTTHVVSCDLADSDGGELVAEIENMKQIVESDDHRHRSLRALALHAQRIGKVLASPLGL